MAPFNPSISAILFPLTPAATVAAIAKGMLAEGHRPIKAHIPKAQHAFPGESMELHVFAAPDVAAGAPPLSLAVPVDPSRVFHLAVDVSKGSPDMVFCGWRRFSGFEPVTKVFFGGKPQWKDGDDADHEVFYPVPRQMPAELRLPGPVAVPTDPGIIERHYAHVIGRAQGGDPHIEGLLKTTWLNRRSRRQPI